MSKWELFGITKFRAGLWLHQDVLDTMQTMIEVVEDGY